MQRLITMPITEARCVAVTCSRADSCARHLIPAGQPGRPVANWSLGPSWFAAGCAGYYAVAAAMADGEKKPERRVFRPIGSEV
jgi:hypothetical protein